MAHLHGYDRIESTLPRAAPAGVTLPERRAVREAARDALAGCGLLEVMTFPAAREDDGDALRLGADDPRRRAVRLVNPIQAGEPVLRTHLLPSLLRVVQANRARQVDRVAVFEVGRVFLGHGGRDGLPNERLQAVAALCETPEAGDLWDAAAPPRPQRRRRGCCALWPRSRIQLLRVEITSSAKVRRVGRTRV